MKKLFLAVLCFYSLSGMAAATHPCYAAGEKELANVPACKGESKSDATQCCMHICESKKQELKSTPDVYTPMPKGSSCKKDFPGSQPIGKGRVTGERGTLVRCECS